MPLTPLTPLTPPQSGQSLIEHSYKADSDLSPAGWEYAERLKAAVVARRKAAREERKARGEMLAEENPLLVRVACGVSLVSAPASNLHSFLDCCGELDAPVPLRQADPRCRSGHLLGEGRTTPLGRLCIPVSRWCKSPS
jgi:hypothetical protein